MRSSVDHDQVEETGSVLIVPRQPARLSIYAGTLATAGLDSVGAGSRDEALESLGKADLVLFEIGRGDTDGWDFIRQLRSRTKTLPIIGITERGDGDLVERLM